MTSHRVLLAAACLAVASARPMVGQGDSTAAARQPVDTNADYLVLEHDFATGGGEIVRVFLERGQVYRAEMTTPDVTLQIRAAGGKIKPPRVYNVLGPEASSTQSEVEVYPDVDADYEIKPISGASSGVGTRLRLYRDVSESHRRMAIMDKPGWEIGFELAAGWHSGFAQSNGQPPAGTADPHGGSDVEGCFAARAAPGLDRLGMCAFGIGYQSQVGDRSILWIYTEPRFGVLGKPAARRSGWVAGLLFRLGIGEIERSPSNPWMFAPGAYVERQIRTVSGGSSWSIQAAYHHALFDGFPKGLGNIGEGRPQSDRLTVGLGWYN